ncbi:hypothetical protein HCU64_06740 [Methylobacterium sp. C25]|uniref:hypothetical protein n=1 Tax=Methylobacterium sp. C25 TaxID=2721622 RepID=UPI001F3DC9A0|nr:hypothetical protein [Methylobacterium sp. C25]MCE4223443.1 hypothetical protein [Methylobacterium sp. C25]
MGAQHTSGPWQVETRGNGGVVVRAAEQRPVAEIWYNGDDPVANGHLVAAAPDMLAAAQAFVAPYADFDEGKLLQAMRLTPGDVLRFGEVVLTPHVAASITVARAAIAKAEGC